jgi:hypothetical protein
LGSVFSHLGDVIVSRAHVLVSFVLFSGYVLLWGVFLRNEIEEEGTVLKKKKLIMYMLPTLPHQLKSLNDVTLCISLDVKSKLTTNSSFIFQLKLNRFYSWDLLQSSYSDCKNFYNCERWNSLGK